MSETTRRGLFGRALLALGGLVGVGVAAREVAGGAQSLVLYGRNWGSSGRRLGELPLQGERLTVSGELLDAPAGARVGSFHAAAFTLGGAEHPAQSERLELHTFKLADGSIFGTGTAGKTEGLFAIVGGTGRYAGARGTYVAEQALSELGGDGAARFVFDLSA